MQRSEIDKKSKNRKYQDFYVQIEREHIDRRWSEQKWIRIVKNWPNSGADLI